MAGGSRLQKDSVLNITQEGHFRTMRTPLDGGRAFASDTRKPSVRTSVEQ